MEELQIIQPSPQLAPYIKQYWFLKSDCIGHIQGIIPTGCISLYIHRANPLFSLSENKGSSKMYVTGQSTSYSSLQLTGCTDMICIDFIPHGAKVFFDIPMLELKGQSIEIESLSDSLMTELCKQLADTQNNKTSIALIEAFLKKRLSLTKNYNLDRMTKSINAINNGQIDINKLADVSCLSYKQFKRIFAEYIGMNPKEFLRIIRFQKALYTLQINPYINCTELAFECGYYDQPHLIKEFKTLSGYTPSEYIRVCDPYSDYFS